VSHVLVELQPVHLQLLLLHVTLDSPYLVDHVLVLQDMLQVQLVHLVSLAHQTALHVHHQLNVLHVLLLILFNPVDHVQSPVPVHNS
jgi:hypothetical protein